MRMTGQSLWEKFGVIRERRSTERDIIRWKREKKVLIDNGKCRAYETLVGDRRDSNVQTEERTNGCEKMGDEHT